MLDFDNEAKEVKTRIETLKITTFKAENIPQDDDPNPERVWITDTPKNFWFNGQEHGITLTRREALELSDVLIHFSDNGIIEEGA